MSKINILSPDIISKIAAGEVIERPASVIKELLENSIDAKSSYIELILEDAGKTLIHIKDNGTGIDHDDLQTIFNRHATSKIKNIDDLYAIMSLGFRGEALYSIGAVADVIMQSKTEDEKTGWEIHIRGCERVGLKPCSFNKRGTEIKVRELFFNTPARKKFLKSNSAEINHILNLVTPYTMLHKNIRFSLSHQNKTLIDLAETDSLVSRISQVLNLEEQNLIYGEQKLNQDVTLEMVLGDINITRTRRDLQYVFINGRPVENKNISYHINNVYRLIMPQGAYPFFAVFIHMPPEDIDANVHPTKREVKIKNENFLCALLRQAVEQCLMKSSGTKQISSPFSIPNTQSDKSSRSAYTGSSFEADAPHDMLREPGQAYNEPVFHQEYTVPSSQDLAQEQSEFFGTFSTSRNSLSDKLTNAKLIGVFQNKYILLEADTELLVIDQHAAAERITFEQIITQMQKHTLEVQHLLTPYILNLTIPEFLLWEEIKDKLGESGFETTPLGNDAIGLHTHPALIKNPEQALRQILSAGSSDACDFDTIARRACRGSVMAGDKMSEPEIKALHLRLLNCLDPFTCPHGRPTIIEISESFLAKQFLR
ncbi:MAG: DNA mismatch repair endonuclease MutL [Candidatus Omnitrophica bacterium]|nr:DNA mismatch repair endonuclease MutL [Candidatus Omnitrophota bacterium]